MSMSYKKSNISGYVGAVEAVDQYFFQSTAKKEPKPTLFVYVSFKTSLSLQCVGLCALKNKKVLLQANSLTSNVMKFRVYNCVSNTNKLF